MGYGARALQCLNSFYSGEYFNLDENAPQAELYPDPSVVEAVSLGYYHKDLELTRVDWLN